MLRTIEAPRIPTANPSSKTDKHILPPRKIPQGPISPKTMFKTIAITGVHGTFTSQLRLQVF